jgi:hypothetical protein
MRCFAALLLLFYTQWLFASPLTIKRLEGSIVLDGDVADSGWANALKIDDFVEFSKGDNTAPPVNTTAWLTYDERFLYVAFRNEDPNARAIRAPFVDRDQVSADQDYDTVLLDTQNDRRSGAIFRVNPRGVQTDSVMDDATQTEDFAPDFYYEAAAKIGAGGWTAEMKIPLSSLHYADKDPQTWGVMLTRNYPRDFRYVMASTHLPKGRNCFVCYASAIDGLTSLPRGGHITLAPYYTAAHDQLGRSSDLGGDLKWSPSARVTLDATVNPDFSQIESDVPQVSANTRTALSYPEKRPFFLEGTDLLSTPLRAVYTRSITAPAWGARVTGQSGTTAYTLLAADDRGGGVVVLPGVEGSTSVPQDFRSFAIAGRARKSFGASFGALLVSDREMEGGGHNRVIGPDFLWKISDADRLRGQALFSDTRNPKSIDAPDGNGHAARLVYSRDKDRYDIFAHYIDYSTLFRADNGFMPFAGIHGGYFEYGGHWYPKRGFASFVRPYASIGRETAWHGGSAGFYFEGRYGTSGWIGYHPAESDRVNGVFTRPYHFTEMHLKANVSRWLPSMSLDGSIGERVDYANARMGNGGSLAFTSSVRPTTHLEVAANITHEWLNVPGGELYTADIDRLKLAYIFNARSLARFIIQKSNTDRSAWLYHDVVAPHEGDITLSALYGYRINWQTTFFIGYGDSRLLDENEHYLPNQRSVFMKASYAFQR